METLTIPTIIAPHTTLKKVDWEEFLKRMEAQRLEGILHQWPVACLVTKTLIWNSKVISMSDRPLMFTLAYALVKVGRDGLSKDEIMQVLYPHLELEGKSERYCNAKRHNAVKMMSRTRRALEVSWTDADGNDFHWVWFDKQRQVWLLMQPKSL